MLNHRHLLPRRPLLQLTLLLLSLLFVATGCITVDDDLTGAVTPAPLTATEAPTPSVAPTAVPTPRPTPKPTPEPVEAEVLGFVPHWLFDTAAATIDPSLLTIAAFHSVEAAQDGSLVAKKGDGNVPGGWSMLRSEGFLQLKDKLQAAGVKVVPVIQRTAWTDGTRARMITLLSKKKNRRALAANIADTVRKRGYDGVNLDFEPLPAKVAQNYVQLVREVRAALDEVDPDLHLSVDVVPGLENYDLAALTADDAADLAVIMGYGYRTAGSAAAGSVAPLDDPATSDLTTSVEAALAQADPDRLLLALPWYGVAWSTETDQARSKVRSGDDIAEPATITYGIATQQAGESGRRYQPDQASAWTTYATEKCGSCTPTWRQAWYDDADSFGQKFDYAIEQDLAGVGIWALGMDGDREELRWALRNHLRPRHDERPPGGTPTLDPDSIRGTVDGRAVIDGSAELLLFASDGEEGSGLGYVRIGLAPELDEAGQLVTGRTYPAVERIVFPLGDETTGGSALDGQRSIHVQWRDLAGNWSVPIVIETQVLDPATSSTPADL